MSGKNRPTTNSKKPSNGVVLKEVFQQNQLTAELLRIIISRSEDVAMLKSLSDRKTGKLRVQSIYAEKTISEIEFKEDWRYSKEESLLSQLFNSKIESAIQKKQLEKIAKKMTRINMQFEEDPSEAEMNASEIHVQKIMRKEFIFITYNEKGLPIISLPSLNITIATWRENFCNINKILEACLAGETVNVYYPMFLCVKQSRGLYNSEISRQKVVLEEGMVGLSPNIAVLITCKKSKSTIPPTKKTLSPIKKPPPLAEPDFFVPLYKMMMSFNTEVDKAIKNFAILYFERNNERERISKNKDLVSKALRARNYEKFFAVNPWANNTNKYSLSTVKTLKTLHMKPEALFDLENTYFDENFNLAKRIKVIHSCLVIQNAYKEKKNKKLEKKAIFIQKHMRGFLQRKKVLFMKTEKIRRMFYWERLKHWYKLLANKFKERKGSYSGKDYSLYESKIIIIQKNMRAYLDKKKIVYWKKIFFSLRMIKEYQRFYMIKQQHWISCLKSEDSALQASLDLVENGKNLGNDENSRPMKEFNKVQAKEEVEVRKKYFLEAKNERILILN